MEQNSLTVQANITPTSFRRFAYFEAFHRQKRWKRPVLFAAIMSAFAAVCFAMYSRHSDALLLGIILLLVGLGLPTAYVLNYNQTITKQTKQMHLSADRTVYTFHFSSDSVAIVSPTESETFTWAELTHAYRVADCCYLYFDRKAFLMPQCDHTDDAWALIQEHAAGAQDLRRK